LAVADEILRDRERALEEQFFARENRKLLEQMRSEQDKQTAREGLLQVSGISDDDLIDKLVELGIGPDSWSALSVVPLVEVAWADGKVEAKERTAVLAGAEANGVSAGSPAHQLLENWLARRPDARLLQAWGEYIVVLTAELSESERNQLAKQILGRARSVAEAVGGVLGLGKKVTAEEEVVLQELGKAFDR